MGYKRVLKSSAIVSILVFILSILICDFGLGRQICRPNVNEDLANFLTLFSFPIFLLSLILHFTREQVFRSWLKFARIFLPIAIALIVLTPSGSGGFSAGFGGPDRETVTEELAALFSLISLVLIVYKSIKLRSRKSADNSRTIS